jgi:hypothetical protein
MGRIPCLSAWEVDRLQEQNVTTFIKDAYYMVKI